MKRAMMSAGLMVLAAMCLGVRCGPIPPSYEDAGVPTCVAGSTQACACAGGGSGVQTCYGTGTGYGLCLSCPTVTADAGTGVPPRPDAGTSVSRVRIEVIDTTVAPFKSGGGSWDGNEQADAAAVHALGVAIEGLGPYGLAAATLANVVEAAAFPVLAMPDPYGEAEIYTAGRWQTQITLATEDNNAEDRYFTTWPRGPSSAAPGLFVSPGWIHVPLATDLQVRLHLHDCDYPLTADEIGNPVLRYEDIAYALNARQTVQVNVAAQTSNQVVSVGISVTAE